MSIQTVSTVYGTVQGHTETEGKYKGITMFKAIPYADPPVGSLRWRPPQPPKPWEDVRDCRNYPCRPMQFGSREVIPHEPWTGDFHFEPYPEMSEDCLYLSVCSGAQDGTERRPVYVWFHGGGLSRGYYFEVEFNPYELAKKGVIVVSVGSRLNIFGYLCLPQLSKEQGGISGNYGLMDTLMALEWVHDNIAAFGGDPDKITVGGQSGGTSKSGALACTPANKGYIKRLINQSALNWLIRHPSVKEQEIRWSQFLESIHIDPCVPADELRKIDASRFFEGGWRTFSRMPVAMVHDGYYVPEKDQRISMDRYAGHLDFLSGNNDGEVTMREGMMLGGAPYHSVQEVFDRAKEMLQDLYDACDFETISGLTKDNVDRQSRHLAVLGMSFRGGIMMSRLFGRHLAETFPESRNWTYLCRQNPPSLPEENGTIRDEKIQLCWHSAELWYTFSSLGENMPPSRKWREEDYQTAELMSSYWANFIAKGDPNGDNLPEWPTGGADMGWMELKAHPKAHFGIENPLDEMILKYVDGNMDAMMWEMTAPE